MYIWTWIYILLMQRMYLGTCATAATYRPEELNMCPPDGIYGTENIISNISYCEEGCTVRGSRCAAYQFSEQRRTCSVYHTCDQPIPPPPLYTTYIKVNSSEDLPVAYTMQSNILLVPDQKHCSNELNPAAHFSANLSTCAQECKWFIPNCQYIHYMNLAEECSLFAQCQLEEGVFTYEVYSLDPTTVEPANEVTTVTAELGTTVTEEKQIYAMVESIHVSKTACLIECMGRRIDTTCDHFIYSEGSRICRYIRVTIADDQSGYKYATCEKTHTAGDTSTWKCI